MRRAIIFMVLLGILGSSAVAKDHPMQHAKILNQSLTSQDRGAAAVPLNGMIVAVPIRGFSNVVTIESNSTIYTLSEVGKKPIVFSVGGYADYFIDGDCFVFLDNKGKKHKFGITHMEHE